VTPLVTVVIPTWNRLPLVEDAVKSVIAQTYPHWELVVIDDGSTDGTAERLSAIRDSRIKVLSAPHGGHLGEVRNRGAAAGSGALIAFLDSDDLWLPRKLEHQVRAMGETGAGWSYSRFELMDESGTTTPLPADAFHLKSGDIVAELFSFKLTMQTSTLVVRRELFEAAGRFSEDPRVYNLGEDYELYMRLALRAHAVAFNETLVRIRRHAGNTSAVRSKDSLELIARIYEVLLASELDAKTARIATRLWTRSLADAGAQELTAGKLGRAAMYFGRSARHGADVRDWARALARGIRDGGLRLAARPKR